MCLFVGLGGGGGGFGFDVWNEPYLQQTGFLVKNVELAHHKLWKQNDEERGLAF